MEYVISIAVAAVCFLIGFLYVKLKLKTYVKVIIDVVGLLIFAAVILATGIKETALLAYILLLATTLLGLLMRIISPIILNLAAIFVSKITRQDYKWLTYDQLMEDDSPRYFMYAQVWLLAVMKAAMYLGIIFASAGLI